LQVERPLQHIAIEVGQAWVVDHRREGQAIAQPLAQALGERGLA
jgi:hypothetical protein